MHQVLLSLGALMDDLSDPGEQGVVVVGGRVIRLVMPTYAVQM
jgi:hypothetical protein